MMIDDAMNSDDWVDYDHDYHTDNLNNDSICSVDSDENAQMYTEKINGTINKAITSTEGAFDKLFDSINFNILCVNLNKFHQFLESTTSKEMCLPYISEEYQDIFKNIVRDVEVLRTQTLDGNYRDIFDKIITSVHQNKSVFFLSCVYEYSNENNKALVIKKIYFSKEPEDTASRISSMESLQPSSEMSSEVENETPKRSSSPVHLNKGFKKDCLLKTLAFVKKNNKRIIRFPQLTLDKEDFLQKVLHSVIFSTNFDIEFELKDLYRALWEAVTVHSSQYNFEITSVDHYSGKKCLTLKKEVKRKPVDITVNTNQIIDQASDEDIILSEEENNLNKSEKYAAQLLYKLPRSFVLPALNEVIKFLSDQNILQHTFVPQNFPEQKFYRTILRWGRMIDETTDSVYKSLFEQVAQLLKQTNIKVPNRKKSHINVETGLKDVTYIKRPRFSEGPCASQRIIKKNKRKNSFDSDLSSEKSVNSLSKRLRKNKKIKLQDVINSDKATETPITDLLNKSLRNKKKNKKRKWDLDTSDESLSRINVSSTSAYNPTGSTTNNASFEENVSQNVPKTKESVGSVRPTTRHTSRHQRDERQRKERLIEALSVPIQSEKAMKMMRGMGWSGGALGARGNGITEPIMPQLGLYSGAGFGLVERDKTPEKKNTISKRKSTNNKPSAKMGWDRPTTSTRPISSDRPTLSERPTSSDRATKSHPPTTSESKTPNRSISSDRPTSSDQPTKLHRPTSSDRPTKLHRPTTSDQPRTSDQPTSDRPMSDQPTKSHRPTRSDWPRTADRLMSDRPSSDRPRSSDWPTTSHRSITSHRPTSWPTTSNWLTDSTKHTQTEPLDNDVIVEKTKQLLQKKFSFDSLPKNPTKVLKKAATKVSTMVIPRIKYFRMDILHYILDFVSKDKNEELWRYHAPLSKKHRSFLKRVNWAIRRNNVLSMPEAECEVFESILKKLIKLPEIVQACVSKDHREIKLKKFKSVSEDQSLKEKKTCGPQELIVKETLNSYISALKPCQSKETFKALKFRLLILLNILHFVRSEDEELEVTFSKVVPLKKRQYIESTIEAVNTRLKFGSTPSESGLSFEIKNYIGDKFLGIMFNHSYTSFSLMKYSRSNSPKKSTSDAKRNLKTSVNLGNILSDSSNDRDMEPEDKNKDNKVAEFNNNEVDIGKQDVNSQSAFGPFCFASSSSTLHSINKENVEEQNTVAKQVAETNDENNQTGMELTDEKHMDVNSETTDYNNELVPDKEIIVASTGVGTTDANENFDETIVETVDLTNNKFDHESERKDVCENNNKENVDFEDVATLALENDKVIVENVINTVNSNNSESMDNESSNIATNNENEIVNILEAYDSGSNTKNTDVSLDGDVTDKNAKNRKEGDIIDILDDDEEEMEIDNVIKLDDEESQAMTGSHSEVVSNNKTNQQDQLLQKNYIDEDQEINREEDLTKKVGKVDTVQACSEPNPLLQTDTYIENETSKDIETDKSINIVEMGGADIVVTRENYVNKETGNINQSKDVLNEENSTNEHTEDFEKEVKKKERIYSNIKTVYLVPTNYPKENMTPDIALKIQKIFSDDISKGKDIPLLMCHGVKNGALVYSCHNQYTCDWVLTRASVASDFKVLDIKEVKKIALKCSYYIDFDIKYLFSMIELYNKKLSTKEWVVEKTMCYDNYVIYVINMDVLSINFINASGFSLFAGVDKVHFDLIWD